uniref:Uncharacterized protein n=1 Tax=uncultured bacterium contig00004 TaxID=1181496 RepID=A0A806JXU9_9BACT|nr:hypothetical protein [uncultured bacterium contig00004]
MGIKRMDLLNECKTSLLQEKFTLKKTELAKWLKYFLFRL